LKTQYQFSAIIIGSIISKEMKISVQDKRRCIQCYCFEGFWLKFINIYMLLTRRFLSFNKRSESKKIVKKRKNVTRIKKT